MLGIYSRMLLVVLIWGSVWVSAKLTVVAAPPALAIALRFLLASAGFAVALRFLPPDQRRLPPAEWPRAILAGVLGMFAYNLLFIWGLHYARASDGALMVPSLAPLFTAAMGTALAGERLPAGRAAGYVLAAAGAALPFSEAARGADGRRLAGYLLFVGAAALWALYTLITRRIMLRAGALITTAYTTMLGSALVAVWAVPAALAADWGALGWPFWLNTLYLAAVATVLVLVLWNRGVQQVGAARASAFMFLVPVAGIVLSALLLREYPSVRMLAGGALLLSGVWIVVRPGQGEALAPPGRTSPAGRAGA